MIVGDIDGCDVVECLCCLVVCECCVLLWN